MKPKSLSFWWQIANQPRWGLTGARRVWWTLRWWTGLMLCALGACAQPLGSTFYVDARFTPDECAGLQEAANAWDTASAGRLHADLVFGADAEATRGSAWGRRVIARVDPATMNQETSEIIGEAVGNDLPNGERYEIISLVPSRVGPDITLRGVAMHELGHHFLKGGGHTPDPKSLMYGAPYTEPRGADEDRFVRGGCIGAADVARFGEGVRVCP